MVSLSFGGSSRSSGINLKPWMEKQEKQMRAFREREGKMKENLEKQMNKLKAQNITNQKEFNDKLKNIQDKNDKNLKSLEDKRVKDRQEYKQQIEQMAKETKENMNKLQKDQLQDRLKQEMQLINTLIQQYNDKKEITQKTFDDYKDKLKQIGLEKRRLKQFKVEIDNKKVLNLVLIGVTGHGKSTFGCRLAGDNTTSCNSGIFQHKDCVDSLTQNIKKKVVKNVMNTGKDLSIVDTPGILDSGGNDRNHANNLIQFLRGCGGVNAFLLVKTRYPPRFDAAFKDTLATLEILLTKDFWKHVIVVITHTKNKDAVKEHFDKYSSSFRNSIYKDFDLDKNKVKLPFIGVDSFDNYKKPIKQLIKIIPKQRFKCDELRSPLQELILKNKNTCNEFENMKNELNAVKSNILLSKEQIDKANDLLSNMINDYKPELIDISNIENDNDKQWEINMNDLLPTDNNNTDTIDDMSDMKDDIKQQFVPQQAQINWIPSLNPPIIHKYFGELLDDDITLKLMDKNFLEIKWDIKLNQNDNNYNKWKEIFYNAEDDGDDVYVTITVNHYINGDNKSMTKMERIIIDVKVASTSPQPVSIMSAPILLNISNNDDNILTSNDNQKVHQNTNDEEEKKDDQLILADDNIMITDRNTLSHFGDPKNKHLNILIISTEERKSTIFKHTVYIVESTLFNFVTVARRYNDFKWLHNVLCIEFLGIFVPPIPSSNPFNRFDKNLISQRLYDLERFLNRLYNDKMLNKSESFKVFLTQQSQLIFEERQKEIKHKLLQRKDTKIAEFLRSLYPNSDNLNDDNKYNDKGIDYETDLCSKLYMEDIPRLREVYIRCSEKLLSLNKIANNIFKVYTNIAIEINNVNQELYGLIDLENTVKPAINTCNGLAKRYNACRFVNKWKISQQNQLKCFYKYIVLNLKYQYEDIMAVLDIFVRYDKIYNKYKKSVSDLKNLKQSDRNVRGFKKSFNQYTHKITNNNGLHFSENENIIKDAKELLDVICNIMLNNQKEKLWNDKIQFFNKQISNYVHKLSQHI